MAVVQGEEQYDQPEEQYNEAGDVMEPFHLKKEREVSRPTLALFHSLRSPFP